MGIEFFIVAALLLMWIGGLAGGNSTPTNKKELAKVKRIKLEKEKSAIEAELLSLERMELNGLLE